MRGTSVSHVCGAFNNDVRHDVSMTRVSVARC